jgi:hypothetical protein
MNNYDKLKIIDPKKFLAGNDYGIFFSLALMSNDLGDLIHLQGLHARAEKKPEKYISAENGRKTGRNIYILRLAFSNIYNILEFFSFRIKDVENNPLLRKIIDECLSKNEKTFWNLVIKLSQNQNKFGKKELSIAGINPEFVKVVNLSEITRNNVTFHYHGTSKHLKTGFELAFKNSKQPNTQYAYVTETENIAEDRRYYIDIALQRFLEEKAGISDVFAAESLMIEFMAAFNKVVYKILCEFHKTLGFEDINSIKTSS